MRTLNQKQVQKRDYILQKNYIFNHINKCGGGAIEAALCLPRLHMTAAEYIHFLGRERWDSIFSFSFVRNPWDKVESHYTTE
jgi:chondroitin 4-sulfotransferase 11